MAARMQRDYLLSKPTISKLFMEPVPAKILQTVPPVFLREKRHADVVWAVSDI